MLTKSLNVLSLLVFGHDLFYSSSACSVKRFVKKSIILLLFINAYLLWFSSFQISKANH
jgi:hypothetical protein